MREDLGARLRRMRAYWDGLSDAERRQHRAELLPQYIEAGWQVCPHDTCAPWDCDAR